MSATLHFVCFFAALLSSVAADLREPNPIYFRSDGGIARGGAGPLPENFEGTSGPRWRVPIDEGQSTPIISNGKIFLTTHNPALRQVATLGLDAETGKNLWAQTIQVDRIETYHPENGTAAPATPACDGQRLYVFFGSYGLICYDLNGRKVWEHRMGPFQEEYGAGSSPILFEDKLILNQDHDTDSFLIAFDRVTGRILWKTARPDAVRSYATPVVWSRPEGAQLLVAGALELTAYNPQNGQKLWSVPGLARIVIPLPIPDGDKIYMASWAPGGDAGKRISLGPWAAAIEKWDQNKDQKLSKAEVKDKDVLDRFFRMDLDQDGLLNEPEWNRHAEVFTRAKNSVFAIKPSSNQGELKPSDTLWTYAKGVPYVSTPLLDNGVLWMAKDGGIVTRLDVSSGKPLSEERIEGGGSYYASPVAGDGKVYVCSEPGVVTVLANQPDWKVLSSHAFHERIHATPLIYRDRIYIRTAKALYCFPGKK